jgi:Zn-dependent protease with chaperone function
MVASAVALGLAGVLLAPHLLPQERVAAASGIALWTAVLFLRAILAMSLVVILVLFLPATQLFSLLTHWCLHAVVPFVAAHLGFDGHALGDAAVLVPGLVMAVSLVSVGFGLWRGTRAVRRWVQRSSLGPGPASSVIIRDSEVVVAAAGLREPRVVVSAGALLYLDDAELAAGLEHEWGHVRRRHRFISLSAELCRAISRLLPGGKRALAALRFHLERDADDYAVRRTGDPLALGSAICKAAQGGARGDGPAFASLAGSGVPQRLRRLAQDRPPSDSRAGTWLARTLATLMVATALGLVAATPTLASAGLDQLRQAGPDRFLDCE